VGVATHSAMSTDPSPFESVLRKSARTIGGVHFARSCLKERISGVGHSGLPRAVRVVKLFPVRTSVSVGIYFFFSTRRYLAP
jgi:hypothetical protein